MPRKHLEMLGTTLSTSPPLPEPSIQERRGFLPLPCGRMPPGTPWPARRRAPGARSHLAPLVHPKTSEKGHAVTLLTAGAKTKDPTVPTSSFSRRTKGRNQVIYVSASSLLQGSCGPCVMNSRAGAHCGQDSREPLHPFFAGSTCVGNPRPQESHGS